jgi:hypothetical protein
MVHPKTQMFLMFFFKKGQHAIFIGLPQKKSINFAYFLG